MKTGMRGFGHYKVEILREIYQLCKMDHFRYRDVKDLPSFERKGFFSLCSDGYIYVVGKKKPAIYKLAAPSKSHKKGEQPSFDEWFIPDHAPAPAGVDR